MARRIFIVLFLVQMILSCSNDDDTNNDNNELAINIVTGIYARQDNFSGSYLLGNPNTRMPLSFNSISIVAFPNPVRNAINIELSQTNEVIEDVYLLEATAKKDMFQDVDYEELLTSTTYSIEEVSEASMASFSDFSSNYITLNLEGYDSGYYRLFIKTSTDLYWDNIYIENDNFEITEFFDSWD